VSCLATSAVCFVLPSVHSGLFKTDKVVGSAQLKLEALDNQCEIREIIEVGAGGAREHKHSLAHHMLRTGLCLTLRACACASR